MDSLVFLTWTRAMPIVCKYVNTLESRHLQRSAATASAMQSVALSLRACPIGTNYSDREMVLREGGRTSL